MKTGRFTPVQRRIVRELTQGRKLTVRSRRSLKARGDFLLWNHFEERGEVVPRITLQRIAAYFEKEGKRLAAFAKKIGPLRDGPL